MVRLLQLIVTTRRTEQCVESARSPDGCWMVSYRTKSLEILNILDGHVQSIQGHQRNQICHGGLHTITINIIACGSEGLDNSSTDISLATYSIRNALSIIEHHAHVNYCR